MKRYLRITSCVILILVFCTLTLFAQATTTTPKLLVHYIDVGQADCILVQSPAGKTMLIDAGNNGDATAIEAYLKKLNIKKIDVLIATHPHEDHIGGMTDIIKAYTIGKIYMSKAVTTTKTFKDLLTALKAKNLKVTTAAPGAVIDLDPALKLTILAPVSTTHEDLNNYSVVLKLVYSKTSFIFTGDAETDSEKEMLAKKYNLKADVLKVGHHGSSSSTSSSFLKAIAPKYAVISVGKDNDYKHPHKVTMDRLKAGGIKVFRTDENGTIVCNSDGTNITFNCKPGSYQYNNAPAVSTPAAVTVDTRIVYYVEGGKSYHFSKDCSTLSRSSNILQGKLSDVIKLGKSDPCDICVK